MTPICHAPRWTARPGTARCVHGREAAVQPGRPRHGQLSAPLLCMGSWLARCGRVGRPRPCYRARESPTRVGAAADGTLRSGIVWRLDLIVLWLRFVTGGSSRLKATCHISFVAAMWLARYVPTINYGCGGPTRVCLHAGLFACAPSCRKWLFVAILLGILEECCPFVRLTGRASLTAVCHAWRSAACMHHPERCAQLSA